jgi:hypothetical protein
MIEWLGKILARAPVDGHELGDLITLEDRVEAIEVKVDAVVARVAELEHPEADAGQHPPRPRDTT